MPAVSPRPVLSAALLVALAMGCSLPAHAQWKWRDANGRLIFSDRPPPRDVAEKDILGRPEGQRRAPAPSASAVPASGAAAAGVKTALDREVEARKKAAEQEQAAKTKADEERQARVRAENCLRARNHIAALETGQRMARMNERGEREVLDDAARAAEVRQAREVMSSDCR